MSVAVVTDSTAMLPAELAAERGITVIPLQVVIGSETLDEGSAGATPEAVAAALRAGTSVSTSRPTPTAMLEAYAAAAARGATEVVSIHLSGEMSGTYESALVAARRSPIPVLAVDSRQVGVATGYAVLSAADVLDAGGSAAEAAEAARERADASSSFFYVDTLEFLRRGGRIGTARALLGGALSMKPLLQIADGVVESLERVRTSGRALARLEELAVVAAGESQVDVYVAHLAHQDPADALAEALGLRLADGLGGRPVWCGELGAVLGAHVGPGTIAVCVAPLTTS